MEHIMLALWALLWIPLDVWCGKFWGLVPVRQCSLLNKKWCGAPALEEQDPRSSLTQR